MRTTRTSGSPGPEESERAQDSFLHAEDFARAVDAGMSRSCDPTLNRELALVAELRLAGNAVAGPDACERDRIRQRIMAEFPTVTRDADYRVVERRRVAAHRAPARWRAIPEEARGRLLVAAAAALCLLMSLSGMSLLLSRDALPGDALYAFKRSAESAQLGLTFGDESKAFKHLEFANARVSEIEVLAEQADSADTWSTGDDKFLLALDDFELDTTAGARLLTGVAAGGQGSSVLAPLRGWAEQQETRLRAVRGALPVSASTSLDSTFELLDRVIARVAALDERSDCHTISSGSHDDLGLLPSRTGCASVSSNVTSSTGLLPQADVIPGVNPADGPVPGLLATPSGISVPGSAQSSDELGLPSKAGDVLGTPGESGSGSGQSSSENESAPSLLPSILPLQVPWILPLPAAPPELEETPAELEQHPYVE